MSYAGPVIGQSRPFDILRQPSQDTLHRSPPHTYQASTKSPQGPVSPGYEDNIEDPALVRFPRLKQRDLARSNTGSFRLGASTGPRTINSPPNPEKWSVKDTTVNVATAFSQAANGFSDNSGMINPNNSWASTSNTRPRHVPRSTSVEYEQQSQSTSNRRLAAPPSNRLPGQPKPLSKSKTNSLAPVPDSEGEEENRPPPPRSRGKSPIINDLVEGAGNVVRRVATGLGGGVTFHMRQRSEDPQDLAINGLGHSQSYSYEAEDREMEAQDASARRTQQQAATHKKGRMSMDNKEYRPTHSDLEDDEDEDFDDDDRRTRRKKKKELGGGPLRTLPVTSYGPSRKKKRGSGQHGAGGDGEDDGPQDEHSDHQTAQHRRSASVQRPYDSSGHTDPSFNSMEEGLGSIPEVDERDLGDQPAPPIYRKKSKRQFSIGGFLGKIVNTIFRLFVAFIAFIVQALSALMYLFGSALGTLVDVVFGRPVRWLAGSGTIAQLFKLVLVAATVSGAYYMSGGSIDSVVAWLPTYHSPTYFPPDMPAADVAALNTRLQAIENTLSHLTLDIEHGRKKQDKHSRNQFDLLSVRLGDVESRVGREAQRAIDAEERINAAAHTEVEELRAHLKSIEEFASQHGRGEVSTVNDEALKALQERLGLIENDVKDALEMGKQSVKTGSSSSWWNKLSGSTSSLTIKSSDGQDVTTLISHLVDSAVSLYGKDNIARPDYAAYAGGGKVIPQLTSPSYVIQPHSTKGKLVSFISGHGEAVSRPPIVALNHEAHNGYCWAFPGFEGQLGVMLAAPVIISDITIDHVARETAFDIRTAPQDMEVWGLVEGKDNMKLVKDWRDLQKQRAEARRREAEALGQEYVPETEPPYPLHLPRNAPYLRIASFRYDIDSPRHIQTFPVLPEIQELGIDFGIVMLHVKSNWGRDDYTCLYRFRVHGERLGEIPPPTYPDL